MWVGLVVLLVVVGAWLLPYRAMLWPGRALGWIVGRGIGVRRAHVVDAIERAGLCRPEAVADGMYRDLGRGLCELLWMATHPWARAAGRVALDLGDLAPGRGVVVSSAHTGNFDLVACAVAEARPLLVVTKHFSVRWIDRIWQGFRSRRMVRLVGEGRVAQAAREALGRGQAVALMVDQAPERRRAVVATRFLGRPVWVDLAPALLAARAHVPIAVVFPWRAPDGTHRARVTARFDPPRRPSRRWAEETLVAITALLEDHVRKYPEQWLWLHRRWKGFETDRDGATAPAAFPSARSASLP
jgi:KDO2-lipid IV(A) lauroyltransferase